MAKISAILKSPMPTGPEMYIVFTFWCQSQFLGLKCASTTKLFFLFIFFIKWLQNISSLFKLFYVIFRGPFSGCSRCIQWVRSCKSLPKLRTSPLWRIWNCFSSKEPFFLFFKIFLLDRSEKVYSKFLVLWSRESLCFLSFHPLGAQFRGGNSC